MSFINRLFFITPIENLQSIMDGGILSYNNAREIVHDGTFAMSEVQERRDNKSVPNGLPLHDYANLYFHPRNPAMYLRRGNSENICVLVISGDVLNIPGAVISDMNAASEIARFYEATEIDKLDFERIYAKDWNRCHGDNVAEKELHKKQKCAEALIPSKVEPVHVIKICVVSEDVKRRLIDMGFPEAKIAVVPGVFFR